MQKVWVQARRPGRYSRLIFDGDETKLRAMRYQVSKLHEALRSKKTSHSGEEVEASKNEELSAELIQLLDDKSLS